MANRKAIVTLLLGSYYERRWQRYCRASWEAYASAHGYDLQPIRAPLDVSPAAAGRSAAWQKCLVLSDPNLQSSYNRVVWIDSDIVINPQAPCVTRGVPPDQIGAVDALEQFSDDQGQITPRVREYLGWKFGRAEEYYETAQLPPTHARVVQTGVMVLSPLHHRDILEQVYRTGRETPVGDFEMEHLSFEIMRAGCLHLLDGRFNRLWMGQMLAHYPFLLPPRPLEPRPLRVLKRFWRGHYTLPSARLARPCVDNAFAGSFFLHFAGTGQYLPLVDTRKGDWKSLLR